MSNQTLTKAYTAEAAVNAYRIVKFGSTDDLVVQGAAATDAVFGVVEGVAPAIGERCDVVLVGVAEVQLGGTVARGGAVVSNATGQGVASAAGNRAIGYALASGVSGDVVPVLLSPHTV